MRLIRFLQSRFDRGKGAPSSFIGFTHNGLIGIKSNFYLLPLSEGATHLARVVASETGLLLIENQTLTDDLESLSYLSQEFLPLLARHRHTAAIFLLATGDEVVSAQVIAASIGSLGAPCEYLNIKECPSLEVASSVAVGTANEMKTANLSGLDRIEECRLTIAYESRPNGLEALVSLLQENGFLIQLHQWQGIRDEGLSTLALSGVHAILSFTAVDDFPSGTFITPVINIASTSELHQSIVNEFDLPSGSAPHEILVKVQEVFGMCPTVNEVTRAFEPLFRNNIALLKDQDDPDEICLIPANPILIPFLIDIVSHQPGYFLRDLARVDIDRLSARKILFVGTGATSDKSMNALSEDPRIEIVKLKDHASFHGLARAILTIAE